MRTRILILALVAQAGILFGQTSGQNQNTNSGDDGTYTKSTLAGLLRTQLTITPAWDVTFISGNNSRQISGGRTNVYLHGTAEYYFTERFSMRGDFFYFVNKDKTPGGLKHNHCFETGFGYHLWKGSNIDPYIGAGAGLNIAQVYPMPQTISTGVVQEDYPIAAHIDPIWGPRIGCNFYGQRIFHYFVEVHYVMGTYRPPLGPALSLNELRVSVGLGLNWVFQHKEETVRPTI